MIDIRRLMDEGSPAPGVILRALPAAAGQEYHLVRQLLGLANADFSGPRAIVVGAEHGAGGRPLALGLTLSQIDELRAQLTRIEAIVEPRLAIAVSEIELDGVSLAIAELTAPDDPPYLVGSGSPPPLQAGECWLYDGRGLRPAARADFDLMYATARRRREPVVLVGIGDDPRCECLDLRLPSSVPLPSQAAATKLEAAIAARRTVTEVLGREDTAMGRLVDARVFGADRPWDARGIETLRQSLRTVSEDLRDADLHHRFESAAVRINLALQATTAEPLRDLVVDLLIPELPGLAVAPRLVPPPGQAADQRGYPEVERESGRFRVRSRLGELPGGRTLPAFRQPLRLAVGPAFSGQKIAVRYQLQSPSLPRPLEGRLRLRFVS